MLVLSRKLNEKIRIGDHICVTVVQIAGGKVRVGVEAPRDVPVHRQEVLSRPTKSPAAISGLPIPALTPRLADSPH